MAILFFFWPIPEFTRQRDILQKMKCVKINRSYFCIEQKTDTANINEQLVFDVTSAGDKSSLIIFPNSQRESIVVTCPTRFVA